MRGMKLRDDFHQQIASEPRHGRDAQARRAERTDICSDRFEFGETRKSPLYLAMKTQPVLRGTEPAAVALEEWKLRDRFCDVCMARASFIAVKTGRAMAVSTDDGLAYALVATSGAAQDYTIGTKAMLLAPYGIVEPKDDARFTQAVDNAVLDLMKTKQIVPLYDKWFNSPVPPAGVNLRYPMSAELKHAIEHPSDSGDPAAYTVNP
jgi:hypothetical protein